MSKRRAPGNAAVIPMSREEAEFFAYDLPRDVALVVAMNALRTAHARLDKPGFAIANRNALLLAHVLTGRMLERPELIEPTGLGAPNVVTLRPPTTPPDP